MTHVSVDGTPLEVVPCFCYLGDMLSAGGGCDLAINVRCQTAWDKFRQLLPLFTSKHLSLKTRGRLYSACVRSAMLYGSETWAMTPSSLARLEHIKNAMIWWICGVRPMSDKRHDYDQLRDSMGIELSGVLRSGGSYVSFILNV